MNYKKIKLNNGLNLVSVKKDTKFASIRIGVKVGSIDEHENIAGISHFVEHLVFQGTKNRTNEELLRDLSIYAGDYNAYTSRTRTLYMFDVLSEDMEKTLEISSDMLMNSTLDERDIERERTIILSEIKLSLDDMRVYGQDTSLKIAFKDTDIAKTEDGSIDSVYKITKEQLREHYNRYYVPENTTIVVVSPYDHEEVGNLINKYFSLWENSNIERNKRSDNYRMVTGEYHYTLTEKQQDNIHYIYSVDNLSEVESIHLELLVRRLGFGMSSLLWTKLRSELGVTYDTYADLVKYGNTSILECYAVVSPEDIDVTKKGIEDSISKLFSEDAYKDGLDVTIKEALFDSFAQIEFSDKLSNFIVSRMLEGKDFDIMEKRLEIIKTATVKDLKKLAAKVFKNPCIVHSLRK